MSLAGHWEITPLSQGQNRRGLVPSARCVRDDARKAAAWNRAQAGFAEHEISPTPETLRGAAVLELWISDGGPPRPGMSVEDIKDWTQAIYQGLGSARVGQDGRVLLRALPGPE